MSNENYRLTIDFLNHNIGYLTGLICIIIIAGLFISYFIYNPRIETLISKKVEEVFTGFKTDYINHLSDLSLKKEFKKSSILVINNQKNIIKKALNSTNYTNADYYTEKINNYSKYKMVVLYIEAESENNNPNIVFKNYKEEVLESLNSDSTVLIIYHEGAIDRNLTNCQVQPKNVPKCRRKMYHYTTVLVS